MSFELLKHVYYSEMGIQRLTGWSVPESQIIEEEKLLSSYRQIIPY